MKTTNSKRFSKSKSTRTVRKSSPAIGPTAADGTTCEPFRRLPPKTGGLTCLPEASPVKTFPTPGIALVSRPNEAAYSAKPFAWLAFCAQRGFSWRTWQRCLDAEWEPLSQNWPRSGMWGNGIAYRLRPLVPSTFEIGYSLWPTVRKNDFQPLCWHRARLFNAGLWNRSGGGMCNLNDWAGVWAIKNSHPALATKSGHDAYKASHTLPVLNVEFVERHMGFPVEWTELPASEMPLSLALPNGSENES